MPYEKAVQTQNLNRFPTRPRAQGLYDPRFEHDACGVGLVCHLKGHRSHAIIRDGLKILVNLTLRGNINWMNARQHLFRSELFGADMTKLFPITTPGASDSAILDNAVELLYHTG